MIKGQMDLKTLILKRIILYGQNHFWLQTDFLKLNSTCLIMKSNVKKILVLFHFP